ncbi:hypothetical protein JR316_0002751 [Psilocybe cubensis]|uniref:Uncharacterized protein n=2 Tax=Psilocybe cubensis TaxID=181762 RepID=A0ACB8HD87_PSICU|nr:hypothetical protein JR316_0002751 [Psilocybe cubensis]KAH9485836.1 hypothetical protein JR316_0002751 [Psilocybe cubensis]
MAGIAVEVGLLLAGLIASSQEEKNTNKRDRLSDLGNTLQDMSARLRGTYESAEALLPKDESEVVIWKAAISEKGVITISKAIHNFSDFLFPSANLNTISIADLFYRRFLMRKLEIQVQGILACVKKALPPVTEIRTALGTFDDLVKSGEISKEKAEQAKQKVLAEYRSVDIQLPILPSNQTIYDELHQRDVTTKVYMDEDPSLADTEKWLSTI